MKWVNLMIFLFLLLILLPQSVSAHWGYGDGHISSAIAEWGIIIISLGLTFFMAFRKKKPTNEPVTPIIDQDE